MEHVDEYVEPSHPDASLDAKPEGELADEPAETDRVDDVQTLRDELDRSRQEASENQEKYLRIRADMDNFRKRIERTYADLSKNAKKDLLTKLLGVKDNLERALVYGENVQTTGEKIMEGVRLTQYQLDQLLTQEGVRPIEARGKQFDPHTEEAVQTVDDPDVPDHAVVQVVRKGYTYQDEVLRPAQVVVSVHGDGD
jgi:molecular chaperone GrpE